VISRNFNTYSHVLVLDKTNIGSQNAKDHLIHVIHMNSINILSLCNKDILAGSVAGTEVFTKLVIATNEVPAGSIVPVDLCGIQLVTASFFRTAFKAFRDYARQSANIYPIFCEANDSSLDEITPYADASNDVFVFAERLPDPGTEISSLLLIGKLDDKQNKALVALTELGSADASTLFERYPEVPPVASSAAWSNRLAKLNEKGIIPEKSVGRTKIYSTFAKEYLYGSRVFSRK
jgi:hypothetical protein